MVGLKRKFIYEQNTGCSCQENKTMWLPITIKIKITLKPKFSIYDIEKKKNGVRFFFNLAQPFIFLFGSPSSP